MRTAKQFAYPLLIAAGFVTFCNLLFSLNSATAWLIAVTGAVNCALVAQFPRHADETAEALLFTFIPFALNLGGIALVSPTSLLSQFAYIGLSFALTSLVFVITTVSHARLVRMFGRQWLEDGIWNPPGFTGKTASTMRKRK